MLTQVSNSLGRLWEVDAAASGGLTTRFLYDGDALVAEYDDIGNLNHRYVHGVGTDVPAIWYEGAGVNDATRLQLFANWQGSITTIMKGDESGEMVAINGYDSYGIANETNIGRFQYTGQITITELGLYHYKAWVYSPTLGRFLQTDPIGYEDQVNLYAYVGNDPVNLIDPTGLIQECSETRHVGCAMSGPEPTLSPIQQAGQDFIDTAEGVIGFFGSLFNGERPSADEAISVTSLILSGGRPSGAGIQAFLKQGFKQTNIKGVGTFLQKTFKTSAGDVDVGGVVSIKDDVITLDGLMIFRTDGGRGIGTKAARELKTALANDAKTAGFSEVKIIGQRLQGRNKGKTITQSINLRR